MNHCKPNHAVRALQMCGVALSLMAFGCGTGGGKFIPRPVGLTASEAAGAQPVVIIVEEAEVYQDRHGLSGVALGVRPDDGVAIEGVLEGAGDRSVHAFLQGDWIGEVAGFDRPGGRLLLKTQIRIGPVNQLYRRFLRRYNSP